MPLEEKTITLKDEEGNEYIKEILFTYENKERGHEYVFIYDKATPEDVTVLLYDEKSGSLLDIEDEEEFKEAEEVFNAFQNDPKVK